MGKNRKSYGGGIFDGLTEAVSNLIPGNKKENSENASKNASKNANASKNNSEQNGNVQKEEAKVETMSYGFKQTPGQTGGVAPTGYNVPGNQRQPSEQIMEWATTAGAPTPTSGMRNVAHGGNRRTRRNRNRRNKTGGSRRNRNRSRRNKTGGSRRNRNRSRRNKTGGNRRNRNRSRRNRRN
jgi:hypothetical protein